MEYTFHIMVPTGQPERDGIMTVPFTKPVYPVMTGQAVWAERQGMRQGKDRVHLTVAGVARVGGEGRQVILVAIGAGKRFSLGCSLVSFQGKSQQLVWEIPTLHDSQRGFCASVLGVAIAAFQFWIVLVHGTMQSDHALHLLRNFAVTVDTQIRHRGRVPRGTVTGITFPAGLCM